MYTWGSGEYGQLGVGDLRKIQLTPIEIPPLTKKGQIKNPVRQ